MANPWREWANASRSNIERMEENAKKTRASLADALGREDDAAAKTWALFLQAELETIRLAKKRLERELEMAQYFDAEMGGENDHRYRSG